MSDDKYIVYSRDGEYFYDDEGVIDDAREDGGYYSGERRDIIVSDLVSDYVVDDILERMGESLYDIVGDHAEDQISISDENKDELRNIITNFISENCSCSCWAVNNVQYHSFRDEGGEQ